MKKYLLLIAAAAIVAGCSKHEVVEKSSLDGTATKTYSMTVDLMAGQNIYVGTVSFYDPSNGGDGPLEVTYTLTGGWTMTESHVYAGPTEPMPTNNPGSPKIGKFPYQETHANVTTYTYYIPLSDVDMGDFAIAAHAVVNNNGSETAWASGNEPFNDKGWGTYISNFYTLSNYTPNLLYGIQETLDGSLNLVLINANNGIGELVYSEYITGNSSITSVAYDPGTNCLFFIIDNVLYGNDLSTNDPTYVITNLNPAAIISGATFMGNNYYYYDNNIQMIVKVSLSYNGTGWSSNGEQPYSVQMPHYNYFTVTDIASNDNNFYLIGINNGTGPGGSGNVSIDLVIYDINTSTFATPFNTDISHLVNSPSIAWGSASSQLYGIDISPEGNEYLASISITTGETDGDPDGDVGGGENPEDPEEPPVRLVSR